MTKATFVSQPQACGKCQESFRRAAVMTPWTIIVSVHGLGVGVGGYLQAAGSFYSTAPEGVGSAFDTFLSCAVRAGLCHEWRFVIVDEHRVLAQTAGPNTLSPQTVIDFHAGSRA